MPYNCLGSIPVFETLKRNINVYAIKENKTVLDITADKISNNIIVIDTYQELFDKLTH